MPIHSDINEWQSWPDYKPVFLLTAGTPCQPASVAGNQRGRNDDRWLWPQVMAVTHALRPAWLLFENVPGILALEQGVAFEDLCLTLEGFGYEVQTLIIPACAVDAPHRRDRVWIVADADSDDGHRRSCDVQMGRERSKGQAKANNNEGGAEWLPEPEFRGVVDGLSTELDQARWPDEDPTVPRVSKGIQNRVQRLKALGNAIVPQVAAQIIKAMIKSEL